MTLETIPPRLFLLPSSPTSLVIGAKQKRSRAAERATMVSRAADDAPSKFSKWPGEKSSECLGNFAYRISQLHKEIQAERIGFVRESVERNGKKVQSYACQLLLAASRNGGIARSLSTRIDDPLCKYVGLAQGLGDKDGIGSHEVVPSKNIKLPYVEKLPPYTAWIFLDRNQRMAEDQSVVGRRRIYYDQHGSETLICSDSEEEIAELEEDRHDYSEGEDRIIWTAFEEYGCTEDVQNILSQFVGGTALEIQDRYKLLQQQSHEDHNLNVKHPAAINHDKGISLEKTLSATLDSFDNIFCRRCLVFDCRLHGCSQNVIYPNEKQPYFYEHDNDWTPCSDHCYLHLRAARKSTESSAISSIYRRKGKSSQGKEEVAASSSAEELDLDIVSDQGCISVNIAPVPHISTRDTSGTVAHHLEKQKDVEDNITALDDPNLIGDNISQGYPVKRLKKLSSDEDELQKCTHFELRKRSSEKIGCSDETSNEKCEDVVMAGANDAKDLPHEAPSTSGSQNTMRDETEVVVELPKPEQPSIMQQSQGKSCSSEWKPIEKELYLKGVEIFGRNSCLIARNMLSGLKTCTEVSNYMHNGGSSVPHRSIAAPTSLTEDSGDADMTSTEQENPIRTRLIRKRGRARKLKYSWKSAGHPSIWKRIADGKNQSCKQYVPCGCQSLCGKECPCLDNGTCCEKYCGCSKSCKNRFRGCHCAKSQCRSRQCPCFAAGRECDPDVCRNCWVSCGDGSLGEPPRRGDGQCGNMRLLLRQQQRILLAKSDVAGWGAFLKNSVNKNDYLGEYTGELISHREADKRGKIYDRANSSFLFDLNDQYVLDAYRKGDKLKFANHSSNPNCYAKVMLVAGDHRVGIFAKERIEASEELFYDYRYGPDQAPAWARKPEGSKRDDSLVSQGRAKKHQSH
ncbi:histone-lysine N-methyltransferase EZA1 isoform X2 [Punica granatum]|uniref:[histone H3]-lysine(27) N-trimethyltransferase n=1 Tax=Punica granatum TaxID=22663 RepID=A0A6P8EED7_PUNGR|nr:histone-lysine N-methyltransferase EZA1 isoform X2 [Punica granatum]